MKMFVSFDDFTAWIKELKYYFHFLRKNPIVGLLDCSPVGWFFVRYLDKSIGVLSIFALTDICFRVSSVLFFSISCNTGYALVFVVRFPIVITLRLKVCIKRGKFMPSLSHMVS